MMEKSNNVQSSDEYKQLTSALEILEQQRKTRENDIESLNSLYKQALDDPIQFVEMLIEGKIVLPSSKQPIHDVPIISFSSNGTIIRSPNNNNNSNKNSQSASLLAMTPIPRILSPPPSLTVASSSIFDTPSKSSKKRVYTERDTESHMKPWTTEEQERLNSLLLKYPEEEIAAHRWKKIADELGTRTPKQVASRVQKYFVKLTKMGLPVPGKPPNLPSLFPQHHIKKKKKLDHIDQEKDKEKGKVKDKEKDRDRERDRDKDRSKSINGDIKKKKSSSSSSSSTSNTSTLSKIKTSTTSTTLTTTKAGSHSSHTNQDGKKHKNQILHEGYKCDGCDQEPIVGYRYKCEECIEDIDLCQSCHDSYEKIGSHRSSHHMVCYKVPVETDYYLDSDYKFSYGGGASNYLDPNYQK